MIYNISSYKNILNEFLFRGFEFNDFTQLKSRKVKSVLLRHDVDNDVIAAKEMAYVEAENGVKSTYFFMINSPMYNLFSRHNFLAVMEILSMGHFLGLHYDQGFDQMLRLNTERTLKNIERDSQYLEDSFGSKIAAVSFHQPSSCLLKSSAFRLTKRVNTYDKAALMDYAYFSDSNRSLDYNSLINHISRSIDDSHTGNIQLLIHPMWWVYEQQEITKVWNNVMENALNYAMPQLSETERVFGPTRKISVT